MTSPTPLCMPLTKALPHAPWHDLAVLMQFALHEADELTARATADISLRCKHMISSCSGIRCMSRLTSPSDPAGSNGSLLMCFLMLSFASPSKPLLALPCNFQAASMVCLVEVAWKSTGQGAPASLSFAKDSYITLSRSKSMDLLTLLAAFEPLQTTHSEP